MPARDDFQLIAVLHENISDFYNGTRLQSAQRQGLEIEWPAWSVDFALLLLSLICAITWFTYLTYYHSRVLGFIVTKVAARFLVNEKDAHLQVGSFSFSLLSGKLMIRDFAYVCADFSVRLQDAWFVFRFWRPFKPRKLGDDFSHSEPRVLSQLNGLEVHFYNRVERYADICRLYGLDVFRGDEMDISRSTSLVSPASNGQELWRDLISMIKCNISSGRVCFGNDLIPFSLLVSFEDAETRYTITPPSNPFDLFVHDLKGSCDNFRVTLVKSTGYRKAFEPPPRIMGEGFVILQTSKLEFYYYQEELGVVASRSTSPARSQMVKPIWGTDLKLGKGTILSYGPWADKQREMIYKLFYPSDYQKLAKTRMPGEAQKRIYTSFDVKCSTLSDAILDILFTKNDDTNAIHINFQPGSYVECIIPWIVDDSGFVSTISGQLMRVEASTSMEYRSLLQCETFEFACKLNYPRVWNEFQAWDFNFTICRTSLWLVYAHKYFVQTLINEWASPNPPSLYGFVPYVWNFSILFKEFEVILTANEHNWIDTASHSHENSLLALAGSSLDLSFSLPFAEFQPDLTSLKFLFEGEGLELLMFLPESFIGREAIITLVKTSNCQDHASKLMEDNSPSSSKASTLSWQNATQGDCGWISCCRAPRAEVCLVYGYHSNPVRHRTEFPAFEDAPISIDDFDPTVLQPDRVLVTVEVGPTMLKLTGVLFRLFLNVKDNYFGECQMFTDLDSFNANEVKQQFGFVSEANFDAEHWRPLHVTVSVKLYEIQAHCLTFQTPPIAPGQLAPHVPLICIEQLAFEMQKQFRETLLQLCISPAYLHLLDSKQRPAPNNNLFDGQLLLSSLQLRGHGMFSNAGDLPIDAPTLEYAWLLELTCGDLTGRLTLPQSMQVVQFLETLLASLLSDEDCLPYPKSLELCQHMQPRSICRRRFAAGNPAASESLCGTEYEFKYKLLRISTDTIDISVAEANSALNLRLQSLRFAYCTVHTAVSKGGLTLLLHDLTLRQFALHDSALAEFSAGVLCSSPELSANLRKLRRANGASCLCWLECGKIGIPDVKFNLALPLSDIKAHEAQQIFLRLHDNRTKRLSFLWQMPGQSAFQCGCVGGCLFFGDNLNGPQFFHKPKDKLGVPSVLAKGAGNNENWGFGQSIINQSELCLTVSADSPFQSAEGTGSQADALRFHDLVESRESSEPSGDIFFDAIEAYPLQQSSSACSSRSPQNELSPQPESSSASTRLRSSSSVDSFASAVSAPRETTINLYGQLNRPVFSSPVLMSSYSKTLSTHSCENWNVLPALPRRFGGSHVTCCHANQPSLAASPCGGDDYFGARNLNFFAAGIKCGGTSAPAFSLVRPGLNDICLVLDRDKEYLLTAHAEPTASEFNEEDEFSDTDNGSQDGGEAARGGGSVILNKREAMVKIGEAVNCFVSPLGIEVLQRFLDSYKVEFVHEHPACSLQKLFTSCSNAHHPQNLFARLPAKPDFPVQFHLLLPRLNLTVFQCGVVEKIVPFATLDQIQALTPSSALLATVSNFSVTLSIFVNNDQRSLAESTAVGGGVSLPEAANQRWTESANQRWTELVGAARLSHLFYQLVQVSEKHSNNIGISRNASRIPYRTNWAELAISNDFVQCSVMEGGVQAVVVQINRHLKNICEHPSSVLQKADETTATQFSDTIGGGGDKQMPSGLGRKKSEAHSKPPSAEKGTIDFNFAQAFINFGLCVPVETVEAWPLYDILAPALSSWLHVADRLIKELSVVIVQADLWRRQTLAYLLVEGFEQSNLLRLPTNPIKSKYGYAKKFYQQLQGCPSCLVVLALQRFCRENGVLHACCQRDCVTETSFNAALNKALVGVLSMWRERFTDDRVIVFPRASLITRLLCRPSIVAQRIHGESRPHEAVLSADAGGDFQALVNASSESSSLEGESPMILPREESNSLHNLVSRLHSMSENQRKSSSDQLHHHKFSLTTPQSPTAQQMELLTPRERKAKEEEEFDVSPLAAKSSQSPPSTRVSHSHADGARIGSTKRGGEDLYSWLAREQQRERLKRQAELPSVEGDEGAAINPNSIPMEAYFQYFFKQLGLDSPANKGHCALFDYFGHNFTFSAGFEAISICIIEPKILKLAGTTVQKVSHTERPVLSLQDFCLTSELSAKRKAARHRLSSISPGSVVASMKENVAAVENASYHSHLARIECNSGLSSVLFLNQMVFVVRSTLDTFTELRKQAAEASTVSTARSGDLIAVSEHGAATPRDVNEKSRIAPEHISARRSRRTRTKSTEQRLSKSHSTESASRDYPSAQQRHTLASANNSNNANAITYKWSHRLMDILATYERQQRREYEAQLAKTNVKLAKGQLARHLSQPAGDGLLLQVLFGVLDVSEIRIQAQLTELLVFASISNVQFGHSCKQKIDTASGTRISGETSVSSSVQRTSLNLSESLMPQVQTVVDVTINQSQVLFTQHCRQKQPMNSSVPVEDERNSLLLEVGPVTIDIPLHPGSLHGVVVRGTRNISETLLRELKTPQTVEEVVNVKQRINEQSVGQYSRQFQKPSASQRIAVVHFSLVFRSLNVTAALLPSLKAYYRMDQATGSGTTGAEARFIVEIPKHRVTFDVKGLATESACVTPTIRLDFPLIVAQGSYIPSSAADSEEGYMKIDAEIGLFKHTLTTDLLNQLLFIQEAFMRELTEIVQKITSEKVPSTSGSLAVSQRKAFLYSLDVVMRNIQITATTPTSTAVRVETEFVKFQISNRMVQKVRVNADSIFGVVEVHLVVMLGQLVKHALYEEVEPDFQYFAQFRTQISLRNAPNSPAVSATGSFDKDVDSRTYLLTLAKPAVFVTPSAIDKGILLWLNYKNTYEFWNQQRQQMIQRPSHRSVFEQLGTPTFVSSGQVYFQVTVSDGMYICLPLSTTSSYLSSRSVDENGAALIISLAETGISVCSSGAMVSSGRFKNFCVRFVEEFDPSPEHFDFKRLEFDQQQLPELNACFVPEGTYQVGNGIITIARNHGNECTIVHVRRQQATVCSKTIAPKNEHSSAEWILGIQWQMQGVEVNFNTRIGKLLSLLTATLTSLAADDEDHVTTLPMEKPTSHWPSSQAAKVDGGDGISFAVPLAETPVDEGVSRHLRKQRLEADLNEQSKLVQGLMNAGASELKIEAEKRKLKALEDQLFRDFRREMVDKLKKHSERAISLRDRFGLSYHRTSPKPPAHKLSLQQSRLYDRVTPEAALARRSSDFPSTGATRRGGTGSAPGRFFSCDDQYVAYPTIEEADETTSSSVFGHARRSSGPENSAASTPSNEQQNSTWNSSVFWPPADRRSLPVSSIPAEGHSVAPRGQGGRIYTPPESLQIVIEPPVDSAVLSVGAAVDIQPVTVVPSVDLYLDLKIDIDSGKCHFRAVSKEQSEDGKSSGGRDSGKTSARPGRTKLHAKSPKVSFTPTSQSHAQPAITETCIAIPGVCSKIYYASHSGLEGGLNPDILRTSGLSDDIINHMLSSNKKAQFYMWLALQRMPDETILNPQILDFLEQTLEPIPPAGQNESSVARLQPMPSGGAAEANAEASQTAASASETLIDVATVGTASFPVDVVVYFFVKSSVIRFTNLPYSRVECLLKLPALNLVVTSRKSSDLILETQRQQGKGSSSGPTSPFLQVQRDQVRTNLSSPNLRLQADAQSKADEMLSGGISVTASLSDFELFIFHPFGTQTPLTIGGGEAGGPTESGRKDALSLQINSVTINITRSRNLLTVEATDSVLPGPLKNSVRFSLIVDISSAVFKYDMRRLQEILSFPKAWYRRAIVRRLFLGDESAAFASGGAKTSKGSAAAGAASSPSGGGDSLSNAGAAADDSCRAAVGSPGGTGKKPKPFKRQKSNLAAKSFSIDFDSDESDEDFVALRKVESPSFVAKAGHHKQAKGRWEAVILLAFNFSELDIQTNMGSTMGLTTWLTKAATSQGHVAIDSAGNKNIYLSFRLGSSVLDSKSGIVGGNIVVNGMNLYSQVKHGVGKEPKHSIGATLQSSESRVEWMGTPILIGCVTNLEGKLYDDWKLTSSFSGGERSSFRATSERTSIQTNGTIFWDKLDLMISRATVTDLIRIKNRLQEFIEQEFKSGKRLLLFGTKSTRETADQLLAETPESETAPPILEDPDRSGTQTPETVIFRHHRHWQKNLEELVELMMAVKYWQFPKEVFLGGAFEFCGNEIALACFQGENFREKKWCLFHMRQPSIVFATDARDIVQNERLATLINQDLSICLGTSARSGSAVRTQANCSNMATVALVERGVYMPPQFSSINDWFYYTFSSAFKEMYGAEAQIVVPKHCKEYKHSVSRIFVLPAMLVRLRTEQIQEQEMPEPSDPRPQVQCWFTADFFDHLLVSSDVEALFFLHALVTSYVQRVKPFEKPTASASRKASDVASGGLLSKSWKRRSTKARLEDPTEELKKDIREFVIKGWQMEPTVRFLQVAAYEPFGVDFIMNKLGFNNPWVTIPKWTQRGFMDPMDYLIALFNLYALYLAKKGNT